MTRINQMLVAFLSLIILFGWACQPTTSTSEKTLPVTKISNNLWKKAKMKEDDRREGPHNYFDYHKAIRTRDGEIAPRYIANYKQMALQKALRLNKKRGVARKNLDWIERGPGNVGGRTRGLLIDQRDDTFQTWMLGSAGGGIWRTKDGGTNWEYLTEEFPNLATTTLANSPANPDIIYAGTGEGFDDNLIQGDGIYKSIDNGDTWAPLSSTIGNPQFASILRIVVDPADPNLVIAATRADYRMQPDTTVAEVVGFIMKSTDGGNTWKSVYGTSDELKERTDPSVQQIIADPTDFNILYATVRDRFILKSTDKGESWTVMYDAREQDLGRLEVAISPVNPQVVFFAAEVDSRLFRSTDGGSNWEEINGEFGNWMAGQGWYDNTIAAHPYDEKTVMVGGAGPILSITVEDGQTNIVSLGEIENNTDVLSLFNPLGVDAVLTTEDFLGAVFGFPFAEAPDGLVDVEIRFGENVGQMAHRHVFTASPFDTYVDYVPVPFEVWDVTNNQQLMVSFIDDGDDGVWTVIEEEGDLEDGIPDFVSVHALPYDTLPSPALASFANESYYTVSVTRPSGSEVIDTESSLPVGTISIMTETASGTAGTFFPVVDGYGEYTFEFEEASTKGVHVDHHNILFIPDPTDSTNFFIFNANDGGIAVSKDGGETFIQTGDTFKEEQSFFGGEEEPTIYPTLSGFNTAQFYGVDKMPGGDRYIGGTQDNGSWVSPMDADDTSVWVSAPSGDGFEAAWNYANPDLLLESSQFNNVFRSADGGETWDQVSIPGQGPFITRLAASKQDPDLVFAVSSAGVVKSVDFGLTWTATEMPEEWDFNGRDNTVEVSLASPRVVWSAGSLNDFNRIAVSDDSGDSFRATGGYDQAKLGLVTGIGTHPFDKNTAYALFSMSDGPKILKTEDLGETWTDISGFVTNQAESQNGFPDVATYSLLVMPYDTNIIWAGTEIGIFESTDGGATWNFADNGLPPVSVWEMKIVNDEVVIATFGRGIWTVSLPELVGYEPLPVLLGPQIVSTGNGFNGQIAGDANLRSAYDSTVITVTAMVAEDAIAFDQIVLPSNDSAILMPFSIDFPIETDSIIRATVEITSFAEGENLTAKTTALVYDVDEESITEYTNNFDEGQSDFARLGFNTYQEVGFDDQALHSPHPYPGFNQEFIAVFQKPIEVSASSSIFSFDEVVLVEPGDSEEFGSEEFYDFVTIEGTTDNGQTWTTLDGYDSRRSEAWLAAYGGPGTQELVEPHSINLTEFYEMGDVVYLRFRLVSDPFEEGWGWMIDNIELKSEIVSVKELPATVKLNNFPNPFSNQTILEYTLPEKSTVSAVLYSMNGQQVANILTATQNAGTHTYHVNTASLEAGTYICRFSVNGAERTLKWVKQ
ncbi:MAG: T9SS type A sorting domain-containing protein [Bacteroidota bacterium]